MEPVILAVRIIEGQGLGLGSSTTPVTSVCEVSLVDSTGASKQSLETSVRKKTNNPVWNASFIFGMM